MRGAFYCKRCNTYSDTYHIHCEYCGNMIYEGEECCMAGDNYFCTDCFSRVELEAPEGFEPDPYDLWRDRQLEKEGEGH